MSRIFGDITQIAYLTRDLKKAVAYFHDRQGIGPWFMAENRVIPNTNYRGQIVDLGMSVGLANSGSLQLEIIEPVRGAPSIYNEWLDRHPDELLVQHVSSWPVDFQARETAAFAAGWEAVHVGANEQGRFGYYQHKDHPEFTFEMAELTESRRLMFKAIREAAEGWDGANPYRGRP